MHIPNLILTWETDRSKFFPSDNECLISNYGQERQVGDIKSKDKFLYRWLNRKRVDINKMTKSAPNFNLKLTMRRKIHACIEINNNIKDSPLLIPYCQPSQKSQSLYSIQLAQLRQSLVFSSLIVPSPKIFFLNKKKNLSKLMAQPKNLQNMFRKLIFLFIIIQ